jgi:hypothetical protein
LKKIKFVVQKELEDILPPSPMKNHIPQWYKDGETYDENGAAALKTCVPFLDVMLSGYAITTINDIQFTKKDGVLIIQDGILKKDGSFEPIKSLKKHNHGHEQGKVIINSNFVSERKSNTGSTIPRPPGYMNNHFTWPGKWGWKVPRGYSVIVTHPFNRFDLPFTTMSGAMDSDGWVSNGNIPFFLKENFEGIIPKNTPVAQIFPYKRESWQMSISKILRSRFQFDHQIDRSVVGYYKKKHWNRKNYN